MAEVLLGNVVIMEVEIALQGRFQVAGGSESRGVQHLGDTAVAAPDHVRVSGLDQAMLDTVGGASLIEDVSAGGFTLASGAETVGELLAVVGQCGANVKLSLGVQALQKVGDGGGGLVELDLEINQRLARSMATNR